MLRRVQQPQRKTSSRERPRAGPWLLVFGVALALRLIVGVGLGAVGAGSPEGSPELQEVASSLASGGGYALRGPDGQARAAAVPPLVPWLASLTLSRGAAKGTTFLVLQCVIGAVIPLLIGMLGASMFGASVGRVAAWITAVSPVLVLPAAFPAVAITFSACVLAALAAASSWVKTPRPSRALGVGFLLGLATLAHPAAIMLPLIVAFWAWIPLGLTISGADRNRQMLLLFVGLGVTLAPWVVRNTIVLKAPVLSTAVGQRLLEGNNDVAWGDPARRGSGVDVTGVEPWRTELMGSTGALAAGRGASAAVDRDRRAAALAWRFLAGRVAEWPAAALAKVGRLWTTVALEGSGWTGAWPASLALRIWSFLALPLALYGAGRTLLGPRRWFQALLTLVILAFVALAALFYATPTLRLPIEPLVLLFVASGLEDARRRIRTRGRGLKLVEGRR